MTESELLARIDVVLGGRAAEELIFGEISTGAAHDLGRATEMARQMVMDHGMSDRYRNTVLRSSRPNAFGMGSLEAPGPREIAETTQQYVDERIAAIIKERYALALSLLGEHEDLLRKVAARLLEHESINDREFKQLLREEHGIALPRP